MERVQALNRKLLEIAQVSPHHCHLTHQRCGCDPRILDEIVRSPVHQPGPMAKDHLVHRYDAAGSRDLIYARFDGIGFPGSSPPNRGRHGRSCRSRFRFRGRRAAARHIELIRVQILVAAQHAPRQRTKSSPRPRNPPKLITAETTFPFRLSIITRSIVPRLSPLLRRTGAPSTLSLAINRGVSRANTSDPTVAIASSLQGVLSVTRPRCSAGFQGCDTVLTTTGKSLYPRWM